MAVAELDDTDPRIMPSQSTITSPMAPDSQSSEEDDPDTKSLSESITDYPSQWGRRYHKYKEGSYLYPNDEEESCRLNMQHDILKMLHDDKIFFAPLSRPEKILDIGTGTGIWPIEMAEKFPNASITGTDLSPIQPAEVPPNVFFEIDDCSELDWNRKPSSFDLIHASILLGSLTSFSNLVKTARRYLKPGKGWLECQEIDPMPFSDDKTIPPDWPGRELIDNLVEGSDLVDPPRPLRIADKIANWMRQAGYVDIHERIDKIPINAWPRDPFLKQLGRCWEVNLLEGLAASSYKILGPLGLGWTQPDIEVFLAQVRHAIRDRHVHAYLKIYVVYGRRPCEEEEKMMRRVSGGRPKSSSKGSASKSKK